MAASSPCGRGGRPRCKQPQGAAQACQRHQQRRMTSTTFLQTSTRVPSKRDNRPALRASRSL
eukprot:749737-Hanusia_phi.AAC.4